MMPSQTAVNAAALSQAAIGAMTFSQTAGLVYRSVAEVPVELAHTISTYPLASGTVAAGLFVSVNGWKRLRPRMAARLSCWEQTMEKTALAEQLRRWQGSGKESLKLTSSASVEKWERRIPDLGPIVMTLGLLYAVGATLAAASNIPEGSSYDTEDFRKPLGSAVTAAFFLSAVLAIGRWATQLERLAKQANEVHFQRLASRARLTQKIATSICLIDDMVPLVILLQTMFC